MRKRYLCFFTVFFAAALAVSAAEDIKINISLLIGGALLGSAAIGFFFRRVPIVLFCCVGFLSGILIFNGYTACFVDPLYDLDEKTQVIFAEVCDYPIFYDDAQRVEVKVDTKASGIDYIKPSFRTLIYLPLTSEALKPGDQLEVTTFFYIPSFSEGFDRKSYQASQGRFIQASSTSIEKDFIFHIDSCEKIPVQYFPLKLAAEWKDVLMSHFDQRIGGFMISLLIGDNAELSDRDDINLKKSGLSHIIAVSGMHLVVLVAFATRIFGKRLGTIISIPLVFFFACMAGNTPSVMRSTIMVIAAAVSFLLMDEMDSLTILAFSLLVLLLHNPYSIASISLQLSYLSTLGLMLYADRVVGFFDYPFQNLPLQVRKVITCVTTAIACSLCAMLFTTPVLLYTYGYVTLISLIANLFTIGIVNVTFICGLILCVVPIAKIILVPIIGLCVDYILLIAEHCADLWWLILDWNGIFAKIAVFTSCIIIIFILIGKYIKPKFTLPALCAILCICVYQNADSIQNTEKITIHAVGNGQMITVAKGRERLSLIDCGSSSNRDAAEILNQYMLWNDFEEIDELILTAVDKTHARGLSNVLERFPIKNVIIPSGLQENEFTESVLQEIRKREIPYVQWEREGESELDSNTLSCSLIGGTDRKLGVRLNTDSGDILIMHSFTQKMMDELLQTSPIRADQLVLSTSNIEKAALLERALDIISPDKIIFSAGGNYVASKLYGIPTRNTYLEGDITFYLTKQMEQ